jgi:hypothetical protein
MGTILTNQDRNCKTYLVSPLVDKLLLYAKRVDSKPVPPPYVFTSK